MIYFIAVAFAGGLIIGLRLARRLENEALELAVRACVAAEEAHRRCQQLQRALDESTRAIDRDGEWWKQEGEGQ